ncbi:iron transporter [Pseudothauera rhizosphaerae]|uniref:Iron transporter n=1 Tax=Pseudothauera rhizosphaerae TaxID=2565932 RepID=A0A4S4AT53_9RHOO|nr:iron transporter [Pseudothauera rhizosphaerae]THF62614.1 iron transporter [Pseudothauera rhizosphaerae]
MKRVESINETRYRLGVASRVLAAAIGGYALMSALMVLLALPLSWWWPMARGQAVMIATYIGFLLYVPVVLWVFHTCSAARAWAWLLLWTALASLTCWWLLKGGAA